MPLHRVVKKDLPHMVSRYNMHDRVKVSLSCARCIDVPQDTSIYKRIQSIQSSPILIHLWGYLKQRRYVRDYIYLAESIESNPFHKFSVSYEWSPCETFHLLQSSNHSRRCEFICVLDCNFMVESHHLTVVIDASICAITSYPRS